MNISPVPSSTFRIPNVAKTRSSYFGYSLNLRQDSIIVGAPRLKSQLKSQIKIDEPGVVFKCFLDKNHSCEAFNFDITGNNQEKDKMFHAQKKDSQMLGAVMDSDLSKSDRFVVCAPNYRAVSYKNKQKHHLENDHFYHGICYSSDQVNSSQPLNVQTLSPLKSSANQWVDEGKKLFYKYGQSGFSAHITENDEIILGCPGLANGMGTIVRYKLENGKYRIPEVCDPREYGKETKSFGYSVSSGKFNGVNGSTLYVASAPGNTNGKVIVFDVSSVVKKKEQIKKITECKVVTGSQFGEYFGYSILAEDFNHDGFSDLAVSAPYHSDKGSHENGKVYIFMNRGNEKKVRKLHLKEFGTILKVKL